MKDRTCQARANSREFGWGPCFNWGRHDWSQINMAILRRWKPSGLGWIKERAWKQAATTTGEAASPDEGKDDI